VPPRRGTPPDPLKGESPLHPVPQPDGKCNICKRRVQQEAVKGYNEVQGDADFDKMHRPDNSQDATSAAEKVENALEKVLNR
jgi:hypothetical protein